MNTYRARISGHEVLPVAQPFRGDTLSLARQFGIEDEVECKQCAHGGGTVEEEFTKYTTSRLTQNANILKFWAVSVHNFVYVDNSTQ
jgi:hypothetical protein